MSHFPETEEQLLYVADRIRMAVTDLDLKRGSKRAATGAIRDAIELALAEWPAIQAAANERRWAGDDEAPLLPEDRGGGPRL